MVSIQSKFTYPCSYLSLVLTEANYGISSYNRTKGKGGNVPMVKRPVFVDCNGNADMATGAKVSKFSIPYI
ncbi:hypothetical protein IEQ34_023617 [Dendrobium chrysotoxum]|uniref:Uncharacterized protein n=1 Tax=Dendrobium chrysotoxum TaxID=161865 RepID=A0AAV7FVU0_DENCH|nr:hypothetical protein IEQ34_025819 [Dendrobium chrysotoxum]KAH0447222.1 hypothetical protein IEQ34_023958 [Dendrobium chrysotoxum]KAH0447562.1 hypothetical protein IEQ34_023617 [Dendrobium chrysotoxum]